MTLLDHYLKAVRLYLPKGAEREDILSELSEHLHAKLEERARELRRPLTEVEQERVLSEHGDPWTVAARYGATSHGLSFGRQLIGPGLFPFYVRLLLFQVVLTFVVQILVGPFMVRKMDVWSFLGPMAVQTILLTVIFSLIERFQREADKAQGITIATRAWTFPPAYLQKIPRWQSASALVLFAVVATWWIALPHLPAVLFLKAADRLVLGPAWHRFYWPILIVLAMGAAQRSISLLHPEWNWFQAYARLGTNSLLLIMLVPFLLSTPYAVPGQAFRGNRDVELLADSVNSWIWWNALLSFGLYWFINALFHAWFCVQHMRYRLRERRAPRGLKAVVVALLMIAAAPAGKAAAGQRGAPANGAAPPAGADVYAQHCASCHDAGVPRAVPRAALNQMSADSIRLALTSGVMQQQAAALAPREIDALVAHLAAPASATASAPGGASANACPTSTAASNPFERPSWNGWGVDVTERRFQPASMARLAASDVAKLKLKWAFGFAGAAQAYAQPAIVGGRLFVGSATRKVYSLDARTGCQYWAFDTESPVRAAISISVSGSQWTAYFGDQHATLYAVDALSGALRWKTRLDDHATAVITGAPVLSEGTLYVPVSSSEEAIGSDPRYKCCTFRGSVSAVDAATGNVKWKTYTIPDAAVPTRTNAQGAQLFGPSGAAVWDSPTVDAKLHRIYITTGDAYSDPAAGTSDSFLALDANTGAVLWHKQMTAGDAFTMACDFPDALRANCPQGNGPDFDFGSSPMLVDLPTGKRALIAGQKSGVLHALDPDRDGDVLWQVRVGKGGRVGGIQWGAASDGSRVYVALSDIGMLPAAHGTAGAQQTLLGVPLLLNPKVGGGLFAFDPQTGAALWTTPHPGCSVPGCSPAQSAAVTVIPGVVFSGGVDGRLRAYDAASGGIMWDVDTTLTYTTVNGVNAHGGAIDGPGAVVVDGMLYVNSGYSFIGGAPGNVLLAFSVDGR